MLALWSGIGPAARAQTVFEGPVVADGVANAVNVTDSVLQVMQAQSRYDAYLVYGGFTTRWAPGEFQLADGQLLGGNLARYQLGGGVGLGKPSTIGGSAGFAFDGVRETGAEALDYAVAQGTFHFGFGVKDFQLSLGGKLDFTGGGKAGLDWDEQFTLEEAPDIYRGVLPQTYATGVQTTTWSLYHGPTGAFATITYDMDAIYDLRGNVQPLEAVLPDLFGLPSLGLRWIDDRIRQAETVTETEVPGGFEAIQPAKKRFQTDLGTDDALKIGMRTRLVVEWLPDPGFRYAELGMVKSVGELGDAPLGFGFRGALGRPETTLIPVFESFVMLGVPDPPQPNAQAHVAFAYSYGVPDAVTWLPIPSAHVFGLQVVFGPPETSKPIVPIVRGLDAAH